VAKMANRFVKTVRSGNQLYYYLAERLRVNDRTIQRIIRPLSAEQASLLGHRNSGVYDAVTAAFRLPLCGALFGHLHEHDVALEVWAELDDGKTVLPCQVAFEPGEVPCTRFRFILPAVSKPLAIAIALRSSQASSEFPPAERSTVTSDVLPQNLRKDAIPKENTSPSPA